MSLDAEIRAAQRAGDRERLNVLRDRRGDTSLTWITKDGCEVKVHHMSDTHLVNTIKFLRAGNSGWIRGRSKKQHKGDFPMSDEENKNTNTIAITGLAGIVLLMVLALVVTLPLSALWRGFVLSYLWAWFVVPTFHVQVLTVGQCAGLTCVATLLCHQTRGSKDKDPEGEDTTDKLARQLREFGQALVGMFLYPLIILGASWLVRAWL